MNTKMSAIKVKGKSIEEALEKAAALFGMQKKQLAYDVEKPSILGSLFARNTTTLSVWAPDEDTKDMETRQNQRKDSKRSSKPRSQTAPSHNHTSEEVDRQSVTVLTEFLQKICTHLCQKTVNITTSSLNTIGIDRLVFDIKNDEMEELLQGKSKNYEALEHLMRKLPLESKIPANIRLFVDCNQIRVQHEKKLEGLAHKLTKKALKDNAPVMVKQKSPWDRKVIHMTLENNPEVETRSVGHAHNRKLMIIPAGMKLEDSKPSPSKSTHSRSSQSRPSQPRESKRRSLTPMEGPTSY